MIEGLIGKKVGMTQTFERDGNSVPATVILAGPCTVIQKKTFEKDGCTALQIGFYDKHTSKKFTKAAAGHFKKADVPPTKILKQFRDLQELSKGGDSMEEKTHMDQCFTAIRDP